MCEVSHAVCRVSNIYTCRHKIMCFNAQCRIIDFRSASLELSFCIVACALFSVFPAGALFVVFFLGKGERNNKRYFYYSVTENSLSPFQIGKKNKSAVQISCGLFIKGGFFMAM